MRAKRVISPEGRIEGSGGGKFGSLELGRGIAALLVVLDHAGYMVREDRYFGRDAFGGLLLNLHVGVDFFFVLSGFIISTVHWGDAGRRGLLPRYARRRFIRIFPPYWVILTFVVVTYTMSPQLGVARQHEWPNVVASYLLFPMPDQPVLGVGWTLMFEMAFYVLFAGYIVFGRLLFWIFVPWTIAILWAAAAGPFDYPLNFLTSPYHLEFAMGVLVAACVRSSGHLATRRLAALVTGGILIFAGCALAMGPSSVLETPIVGRLVFGAAAAAIIFGATKLEATGSLRIPRAAQALGAMSYSLYLSHVVTESLFMRIAMKLPDAIRTPETAAILISVAGVAGGWAFWRVIERPLLRGLRRRRARLVPVPPLPLD
jgi:peptidoglycan/LPS O-acetylase OafA/YrhL